MASGTPEDFDIGELYEQRILDLARSNEIMLPLAAPTHQASKRCKTCGSTISVQLVLVGGIIMEYSHELKACALTAAAAAVARKASIGCSMEEIRAVRDTMRRMLTAGGDPPTGKWSELAVLLPIRHVPSRHDTAVLVFDAMCDAFTCDD